MESRTRQDDGAGKRARREPARYEDRLGEEKVADNMPVQHHHIIQTKTNPSKSRRSGSTAGLSVSSPGSVATRNHHSPDQDHGSGATQLTTAGPVSAPASAATSSNLVRAKQSILSSSGKAKSNISSNRSVPLEAMDSGPPPPLTNPFHTEKAWQEGVDRKATPVRTFSEGIPKSKGILGRRSSKSNATTVSQLSSSPSMNDTPPTRPRTRTLDGRKTLDRSPSHAVPTPRQRIGSVSSAASQRQDAAPIVDSSPSSTPAEQSRGSARRAAERPIPSRSRADAEPISSTTSTNALSKRIQHLMTALNGRMSGTAYFRRNLNAAWTQAYCFVQEQSGSLLYESQAGDGVHRLLVPDLRGCHVDFRSEDYVPYIVVRPLHSDSEIHLRLHNQADFDAWLAVLLTWHHKSYRSLQAAAVASPAAAPPIPPNAIPRRSSAARSISPRARNRANSDRSRRKSAVMSLREAPVIKIGKMIFWDTDVTYNGNAAIGHVGPGRPQAYRMQSYGSRRWRRISAQLRENGELKLHADMDNSLLSVVQLSQLSRCAIQRLDQSVLENEFCIAIYPQYTSSATDSVTALRPIFLSLETRVLHEVWFVLLRAFTIPQLYGPGLPETFDGDNQNQGRDFENLLAESTTDMFRMERALNIRVVEARLYPVTPNEVGTQPMRQAQNSRPEQFGYHVELLLDNETRAKTAIKYEGLNPLWGETFDFADLPPVLTSASIVIKRRPPDANKILQDGRMMQDIYGFSNDAHGGFSGINFDVTCGKVEIYLDELASGSEVEKWWPVVNMFNQRVGEVLVKARADEGVVLMARDYQPLNDLLHRFANGLTLQLAQIVPSELKRLSDCLLNIFQVSGRAGDWIMALVEDEIDSIHKETPITRLRYTGRIASNDSNDHHGSGSAHTDRELMVRDMNKNATLEANLLFRGNTLLTKSLDSHMRRVGRDFLEESLASKLKEICDKDPDCEVDPSRASELEVSRNWKRLIYVTSEVWKSIVAAKQKCPIELRRIFRHIRACAEDRYGDFLRSVSYSSVSGFLFLRFFCPAVLNPKLFGLMKDDLKPKSRRTLTLVAKSLQTLANMASFGTKEQWMEPMNVFLSQSRETFKTFIDDICSIPVPISTRTSATTAPVVAAPSSIVSADTHLSYTTPMTIMQRLPPTSREGFPSLPYLIDQPRAFSELVSLWLETTSDASSTRDTAFPGKSKSDLLHAIQQSDGDVREFHEACTRIHARTQECLSRAERAERPNSALSFQWEELIDQLQSPTEAEPSERDTPPIDYSNIRQGVITDTHVAQSRTRKADVDNVIGTLTLDEAGEASLGRGQNQAPKRVVEKQSSNNGKYSVDQRSFTNTSQANKLRNNLHSRGSDPPTSPTDTGHLSSGVSSDTDHNSGTTALPSYNKEIVRQRHFDEQEQQYWQQSREHNNGKDKQKGINFVSALRKKRNDRDRAADGLPQTP